MPKPEAGVGSSARPKPSATEVHRAAAWLKIADEAKAWDWLVGRRIQQLRETRRQDARAAEERAARRGLGLVLGERPKDFSQSGVASLLGFSQSWLAKIEQGSRSVTVFEAHHIAKGHKANPDVLLQAPSDEERKGMDRVVRDIQRARAREGITAEQLATVRADAQNRRMRSSPRSHREQERMNAVRQALEPDES
ncbi:MAG: helix-turn-helix domain-containing protein [Gemmatimonas sp.]|jgi:transcriptional regulator with XRE-family HTH domain|uniref:helix-turn-helix domain-containing protein n=1 Tax=Gemmatimonas sp. TaxID=1962908 RepID=UPI00391F5428|nr:helix-turn-helix domain-containing protein [Gemmatimonadota bacterium]